jgi:hypothetical protein
MTKPKEDKPDGWVAWHPQEGRFATIATSKEYAIGDLGYSKKPFSMGLNSENYHWSNWKWGEYFLENGWRIRPVKLIFLDGDDDEQKG